MNDAEVTSVLHAFVEHELLKGRRDAPIGDHTPLVTSGLLDSLATIELLMFLEERFGVRLEAHEIDWSRMDSIDAIAGVVRKARQRDSGL